MKHLNFTKTIMLGVILMGFCFGVAADDSRSPVGKVITGYQGWFTHPGDTYGSWVHWASGTPRPNNQTIEMYPDIFEYEANTLYGTGFSNLGDDREARLFSQNFESVVDKHAEWMKDYDIDGVAMQRFMTDDPRLKRHRDSVIVHMTRAAEKHGRIAYIMYDMAPSDVQAFKADWLRFVNVMKITQYSSYAHVGDKPVVCLWGFGFSSRANLPTNSLEIIRWLKEEQNCYVIGGVPRGWRDLSGNSQKGRYDEVYRAFDMISPWVVGAFPNYPTNVDNHRNTLTRDKEECDRLGIDYQPVVYPGFAWSQLKGGNSDVPNEQPRRAGDLFWRQAHNINDLGIPNMYLAMFDEYDEATAYMKAATDFTEIPTDQYFLTLSTDGYWLSSDFYLRAAQAASRMMKGIDAPTLENPVPHSLGPVYYRNSFEKRIAPYGSSGRTMLCNIDPCFLNEAQVSSSNVSGNTVAIVEDSHARSGKYLAKIAGTASANGSFYYKYADAKIAIKEGMTLTFWKYTVNEQGKYTSLSLRFNDNTLLHSSALTDADGIGVSPSNARGTVGEWTKHEIVIGQGNLIGKSIAGILIGYEDAGSGEFEAYFDDVLIADADYVAPVEYIITVAANSTEGGTVTGGNTYLGGKNVTVTATPKAGYEFVNWTINSVEVANTESYTFTAEENLDLVANFEVSANSINTIVNDGTVILTEYYNLQGIKVSNPQPGELYIVKLTYESGNKKAVKQIVIKK